MAYVNPNFKTKKQLKDAVKACKLVTVYSPGPFPIPSEGRVTIEGPHYPQPHTWYAVVMVSGGQVIKVVS